MDIEQFMVPQKISFPLGLLINEWTTNSIKHAQISLKPLSINIKIYRSNNQLNAQYEDNGSPQITAPSKKSLGLEIIHLLCAQLNATMQTDTDNIFSYSLIIPFTSAT